MRERASDPPQCTSPARGLQDRARRTGGVAGEALTTPAVAHAISGWRSDALGERGQALARELVAAAAPESAARARAFLFAAAKLAAFGESVGLELSARGAAAPVGDRAVHRSGRGRALASHPPHAQDKPAGARPRARALSAACAGAAAAGASKSPYGDSEIAGFLAVAAAQRTVARRMRATALICLGAGAGMVGSELRYLRGEDVVQRSGGLLVVLGGRRARTVPVLARFHQPLGQAAAFASSGYLLGGAAADRRNLSDALCRALSADRSLPRLEAGRLRATWLVACAERIGLGAFMQAAGIRCSQRLGDLATQLPKVPEQELVALLGEG